MEEKYAGRKRDQCNFSFSQFTHVCYRVLGEKDPEVEALDKRETERETVGEKESAGVSLKRKLCILLKAVLRLKKVDVGFFLLKDS